MTAEAGHPLLLGCNVTDGTIRQVSWLHKGNKKLLVYEPGESVRISHQESNVLLNSSHNNSSYITIKSLQQDDEGCYQCIFDIYPLGRQKGEMCVTITGESSFSQAYLQATSFLVYFYKVNKNFPVFIC